MLTFIGVGKIREERLVDAKRAIREYMKTIDSEEGTPEYSVYEFQNDPCTIVFYEQYQNQQAKEKHNENPALAEMMRVLTASLDGDVTMGFVDTIAAKQSQDPQKGLR